VRVNGFIVLFYGSVEVDTPKEYFGNWEIAWYEQQEGYKPGLIFPSTAVK
jgi:hypothetical protein